MTQSRRIAALLGLSACAQASSSSLRDSADAGGQPLTAPESLGEPLVDQLKLDGRAFSEVGEGSFFAYHEGWGYDVEVDADGLHVQHGEEALDIRFSRWGRESSLLEVEGFSPQFGPCTEDGELQSNGQCAQVLVFDHGAGVAEHIENTSAGPRQSWMIASPPSQGAGPLILELEVAGADLDTDEDVVYLTGEFGRSYQYHDLLAWDATGRVLPSFFEVQDGRILIVVDDAHAVYPIDVDPVLDNFADLSKSGSRSGQSFAWDVSSAGDLNGDGIVDLAVGVIWDDQVHIFYGGAGFDTVGPSEVDRVSGVVDNRRRRVCLAPANV